MAGPVERMSADVVQEAVVLCCARPAPGPVSIEDHRAPPCRGGSECGAQPGDARADDDDIRLVSNGVECVVHVGTSTKYDAGEVAVVTEKFIGYGPAVPARHPLLDPTVVAEIESAASRHVGRPWTHRSFTDLNDR